MAFPNLRFRPTIGAANIAQMLVNKPVLEEEMRARRAQEKRQKFNQFLNAMSTAATTGSAIANIQAQRAATGLAKQQAQAGRTLGESLAGQVPTGMLPGAQGPMTQGVAQRQEAMRAVGQVAPGLASRTAIGQAFPDLQKQKGSATQLSALVSLSNNLANSRIFTQPGSKEEQAVIGQMNNVNRRLSTLGGFEFKEIPFKSAEAMAEEEIAAKKKQREESKARLRDIPILGGFLGGDVEKPEQITPEKGVRSPRKGMFKTAKEVRSAYKAGKISQTDAERILEEEFGIPRSL